MFEYRGDKLVVDELIIDPSLPRETVVRIADKYYMVRFRAGQAVQPADIREYKKAVDRSWVRGETAWDFFANGFIPRGGYEVSLGRAATEEEFAAVCREYGLGEDDISDVFADTKGEIFGEAYKKTFPARQIRVRSGRESIALERKLREMGIEATSGSPGRLNIRVLA